MVEEMEDFDSDYNEAASGGGNVVSSAITGKRGVIPVLQVRVAGVMQVAPSKAGCGLFPQNISC